jgi:hypothetical protein
MISPDDAMPGPLVGYYCYYEQFAPRHLLDLAH